jgi:hypothetical protein
MELTHQLTLVLRTLRLSGILETLEFRKRQAVGQQFSFVEFLTTLLHDEVERRAQSNLRLRLQRAAFNPTNGGHHTLRRPRRRGHDKAALPAAPTHRPRQRSAIHGMRERHAVPRARPGQSGIHGEPRARHAEADGGLRGRTH